MCAINLPAREPPDSTTDKRVGREVFLPANTRKRNRRSRAIRQNLCERSRIFMTDDAGDGPGGSSVVRGKGISALPEFAVKVVESGPLSACHIFQSGRDKQAVQGSPASCLCSSRVAFPKR